MKKLTIVFAVLAVLICSVAYGAGRLEIDTRNNNPIQGAAWDGAKSAAVTVYSVIKDMRLWVAKTIYSTVDCWERSMPTATSTKSSYVKTPVIAGQWSPDVVNANTPFTNYTGCTGYLKGM